MTNISNQQECRTRKKYYLKQIDPNYYILGDTSTES